MKYLFSIKDLNEGKEQIYSIEAEDKIKAGNILAKKYMPLISRICYGPFCKALEQIGFEVTCIGTLESIIEVNE